MTPDRHLGAAWIGTNILSVQMQQLKFKGFEWSFLLLI
jgi:hypothetical protein